MAILSRYLLRLCKAICLGLLVLWVWHELYHHSWITPVVLPAPFEVFYALRTIVSTQLEYRSVWFTMVRVMEGVFASMLVGLPMGIIFSYKRGLLDYAGWFFDLIRAVPPAILLPLAFFASQAGGDNDWARTQLVCFGCIPILFLQITDGWRGVLSQRMEYARSLGGPAYFNIFYVLIPEILPNIFTGVRNILSFGTVIVVVTEVLYPPKFGVGARINEWQQDYHPEYVYAYALIVGVAGILMNAIARAVERRVVYWQK